MDIMKPILRFPVLPINPDTPILDKLLSEWKTELARAVAMYVMGELDKQEQDNGTKNTKLQKV